MDEGVDGIDESSWIFSLLNIIDVDTVLILVIDLVFVLYLCELLYRVGSLAVVAYLRHRLFQEAVFSVVVSLV